MTNQENTNNFNQCECNNNFTKDTFMESFANTDDSIDRCASCPNFKMRDGIYECTKFSK